MKPASILLMAALAVVAAVLWLRGAPQKTGPLPPQVVVYVTHDQPFSEPVLQRFERETGVRVKPVYDTEASKTVGLVNRLIAEAANPICDVFWNNEPARMVMLQRKGLLKSWETPVTTGLPPAFKDPGRRWYGFAARIRVLIYNTKLVQPDAAPKSVLELAHPRWKGKAAIANPLFGSTSTHIAALAVRLGDARLRGFLEALRGNGAQVVASNSAVRDVVAQGAAAIGLTDTDDALGAIRAGKPVAMVVPDQEPGGLGALMLPNTVAVLAKAPSPGVAEQLAEFLLSESVERELAAGAAGQIPLRPGVAVPAWLAGGARPVAMTVDLEAVADRIPATAKLVQEVLIR